MAPTIVPLTRVLTIVPLAALSRRRWRALDAQLPLRRAQMLPLAGFLFRLFLIVEI